MAPEPLCLQEGDSRGKPTQGDKRVKGEPATQGHCSHGNLSTTFKLGN